LTKYKTLIRSLNSRISSFCNSLSPPTQPSTNQKNQESGKSKKQEEEKEEAEEEEDNLVGKVEYVRIRFWFFYNSLMCIFTFVLFLVIKP